MLSSNILSKNYMLEIARGRVPGASPVNIAGLSTDIDNLELTVWNVSAILGKYVFPANAGESMEVVSSSIQDDDGGAGIEAVTIEYLDTAFEPQTIEVDLMGQTPVPITPIGLAIARVNRMFHSHVGSIHNSAAGNVDIRKVGTTTSNIYRRISVGDHESKAAVYTIPAGKNFFLSTFDFSCSAVSAGHYGYFKVFANGLSTRVSEISAFTAVLIDIVQDGHASDELIIPFRFLPKSDIYVTCQSDSGSSNLVAIAELRGWLENA